MSLVKRIVLDVLKPHHPSAVEFSKRIAELGEYRVKITVAEMDEKTESVVMVIEGDDIRFEALTEAISSMGASLHSVDEVEVTSEAYPDNRGL